MAVLGIIPARLESERLPRKLLRRDTGIPLIQHTWNNARRSKSIDRLVVATDSREICAVVESFGGESMFTQKHESGTDRVAEVSAKLPKYDTVVNIQGDEPEISMKSIDQLVERLQVDQVCSVATLATRFLENVSKDDPNAVKVVMDQSNRAIYFSRHAIPFQRNHDDSLAYYMHIGVYAFQREFLLNYSNWPQTPLEKTEGLEQLRIVEHGHRISVCVVDDHKAGIDTLDDYLKFVERIQDSRS